MKYSVYIQMRCASCNRVSGAIIIGAIGEEKAIGCEVCGAHVIAYLHDGYRVTQNNLTIDIGINDPNWI